MVVESTQASKELFALEVERYKSEIIYSVPKETTKKENLIVPTILEDEQMSLLDVLECMDVIIRIYFKAYVLKG
jgi:hypothetical protein